MVSRVQDGVLADSQTHLEDAKTLSTLLADAKTLLSGAKTLAFVIASFVPNKQEMIKGQSQSVLIFT